MTQDGATAIYGDKRIPLPSLNSEREGYLRLVIEADSNNTQLKERLARMLAPPPEEQEPVEGNEAAVSGDSLTEKIIPIPGTCQ